MFKQSRRLIARRSFRSVCKPAQARQLTTTTQRRLRPGTTILAIETSCDDSSVAVVTLEDGSDRPQFTHSSRLRTVVDFHDTVTAESHEYKGIHPLVALSSHHSALARLVQTACQQMRSQSSDWKPTLIAATRGPGMRANLGVGLSLAKGLAVAWDIPFVGIHHMQAHALTPRLCRTLEGDGKKVSKPSKPWSQGSLQPQFPYLTVLASGGHTMLLHSSSLTEHKILADTCDIAIGDCLDKAARAILPPEVCQPPYGRALEQFAFPNGVEDYNYTAPRSHKEELAIHKTSWSWTLSPPIKHKNDNNTSMRMVYSFSGLVSQVERAMLPETHENVQLRIARSISLDERRGMAREVLRVAFEHLVSRILLHLADASSKSISTIVISGGVASNRYLRYVVRQMLDARGCTDIQVVCPPIELCTDNALMIAWAAIEMYAAGYTTELDVEPFRTWSMDSSAAEGGILGVPGWIHDTS